MMTNASVSSEQVGLPGLRSHAMILRQAKAHLVNLSNGTSDDESTETSSNGDDPEYEVGEDEGYDTVSTDSVIESDDEDFDDLTDLLGENQANLGIHGFDSNYHGSFSPIRCHSPVQQEDGDHETLDSLDKHPDE